MSNYQFFCLCATIWIASYKPDAVNWLLGVCFAALAVLAFYGETRK